LRVAMKAVILAGGLGTRLRPLTYTVPKALVPLCGKPLISHIVDALPPWIDTVLIAVNYMRDALESYFKGLDLPREIIMVEELEPLGTGGALKNVGEYLDDTFVAFNGDVVSSIDLDAMMRFHVSSGGVGTIALWEVEDPSAFGVVGMGENSRIGTFQEKPPRGQALSNLVNAGVYVFEPDILDQIGPGNVSLERRIFPKVLDRGLFGYRFEGFWVDCGTRENFLRAQRILMDGGRRMMSKTKLIGDSKVIGPNYLDEVSCVDCRVGPYVSAHKGVVIGEGCDVSDSILMEGAVLGPNSIVKGSIVGPGFKVGPDARVIDSVVAVQ
jgi:mannose-1-phosphate guanylyltransferase